MSLIRNRLRRELAISPQRYGGLFRNLFEIKGAPALELPGSMRGEIVVENDRPENLFAQATVSFTSQALTAASVGNTSHAGIKNIAASTYLATVWVIVNNESGIDAVYSIGFLFPSNGNLATVAQVAPSDSRLTTFAPGLFTTSFQGAAQGNAVVRFGLIKGDTIQLGPWVMAPDSDLVVSGATNVVASASFFGYTRPLRASERQR